MKIIYSVYCIFLLLFSSFFLLIALASSHHLDKSYLFVLIFSTVSYVTTIIMLIRNLVLAKRLNVWLYTILIFGNILAFIYYSYDLLYKSDDPELISYSPIIGIVLSILVFLFINRNNKAHR
jgi:hypothetical protein